MSHDKSDDEARVFIEDTESALSSLSDTATLARWTASVDISEANSKKANETLSTFETELRRKALMARSYSSSDPVIERKLKRLALNADGLNAENADGLNADSQAAERRAKLRQQMDDFYEQACAVVEEGQSCMTHDLIEKHIRESRDPQRLRKLWTAWYDTAQAQSTRYEEYIGLLNQGARDSGRRDAAEVSLAAYEVEPAS